MYQNRSNLNREVIKTYQIALQYISENKISAAVLLLEGILKLKILLTEEPIRLLLGMLYMMIGSFKQAVPHLKQARKTRKNNYFAPYLLARAHEGLEKISGSSKYYKEAIKLNPKAKHLYIEYSIMLFRHDLKSEAYSVLTRRIEKNDISFDEYLLLSRFYFIDGKTNESINILETAQNIVKTFRFSIQLGLLYLSLGKADEAINNLEIAIEKSSLEPVVLILLSDAYSLKQEQEKSLEYLDRAYKFSRSYPELLVQIATMYLRFDIQKSFNIYQDYLKMVGINPDAYFAVGSVYEAFNMHKEAQEMYVQAVKLNKSHRKSLEKLRRVEEIKNEVSVLIVEKEEQINTDEFLDKVLVSFNQATEKFGELEEIKERASITDFNDLFNKSRKSNQITSPEEISENETKGFLEKLIPKKLFNR